MPAYPRPSLTELDARINADLTAIPAVLRGPLAHTWARVGHGLHGHLEWIDRQNNPLTCELERLYDWAALYAVARLPAQPASGAALATGSPGAVVLADAALRGPNNIDYKVIVAQFMANSGTAVVSLRAEQTGDDSNLPAGAQLTLIDPLPGISPTFIVGEDGLSGGAADEDVDDWRVRVATEWQVVTVDGARGGNVSDYRNWCEDAHPAITGALVFPGALGPGSVVVMPVCDGAVNRLPDAGVLAAVRNHLSAIAPATADWRVVAPVILPVTVSIHLDAGIDNADNRARIAAAVLGCVLAEKTEDAVLHVAELDAAISRVTSNYVRVAPANPVAVLPGQVLTLGGIAWV
jgi:uncharacterized phage protein gp47/JayE